LDWRNFVLGDDEISTFPIFLFLRLQKYSKMSKFPEFQNSKNKLFSEFLIQFFFTNFSTEIYGAASLVEMLVVKMLFSANGH
jgi:hypothetical protein